MGFQLRMASCLDLEQNSFPLLPVNPPPPHQAEQVSYWTLCHWHRSSSGSRAMSIPGPRGAGAPRHSPVLHLWRRRERAPEILHCHLSNFLEHLLSAWPCAGCWKFREPYRTEISALQELTASGRHRYTSPSLPRRVLRAARKTMIVSQSEGYVLGSFSDKLLRCTCSVPGAILTAGKHQPISRPIR